MQKEIDVETINYGPLAQLIGTWIGEKGKDVAPEVDGEEVNLYKEVLVFEAARDVSNAEEQKLVALHYHQVVTRIADKKMIHNESGYLSWDNQNQLLMKSFSLPRAVAVVAGGKIILDGETTTYKVQASLDNADWRVIQSPFMQQKALTKSYDFSMSVLADEIQYSQSVLVDIFGKLFEHTDENSLMRVKAK